MAQYFTDFESDTIGALPTDWVRTWATAEPFTVQTLAGTQVLQCDGDSGFDRNAAYYSPLGTAAGIKTRGYFTLTESTSSAIGLMALRGNDAVHGSRQGYTLFLRDALTLNRTISGSDSSIATASKTYVLDTKYSFKFEISGSNPVNIKFKSWESTASETDTWDIDYNDSDASRITVGGYAHFGNIGARITNFDNIGIGTNGDPAPTSAPAGGAVELSGSIPSTSVLAGTASMDIGMSGVIQSVSGQSGSLSLSMGLGGQIPATTTLSASLNGGPGLSGIVSSVSTLSANLDGGINLSGALPAISTLTATLNTGQGLSGQLPGTTTLAGAMNTGQGLSGSITGTSALSGSLSLLAEFLLSGSISASSAMSAGLNLDMGLSGAIDSLSAIGGELSLQMLLSGNIAAASQLSGLLTLVTGAVQYLDADGVIIALELDADKIDIEAELDARLELKAALTALDIEVKPT